MNKIQEYDIVALLETIPAIHKDTQQPIELKSGQVGTVVMSFDDRAFLIDFADSQGHTYAMETIAADQLLRLVYEPETVYA